MASLQSLNTPPPFTPAFQSASVSFSVSPSRVESRFPSAGRLLRYLFFHIEMKPIWSSNKIKQIHVFVFKPNSTFHMMVLLWRFFLRLINDGFQNATLKCGLQLVLLWHFKCSCQRKCSSTCRHYTEGEGSVCDDVLVTSAFEEKEDWASIKAQLK